MTIKPHWSEAEISTISSMFHTNATPDQIAKAMQGKGMLRSPRAIEEKLRFLGLRRYTPNPLKHRDPRLHTLYAAGVSREEMAKALGVSALSTVDTWIAQALRDGLMQRRKVTSVWTDEKGEQLKEYVEQGLGPKAINKLTGWPCSTISQKAKKLGLKFARPAPVGRDARRKERAEAARAARAEAAERAEAARRAKIELAERLWRPTETSKPFLEREAGECRWPLGERGSYHACCKPKGVDLSYCREHRAMAGGYRRPWVSPAVVVAQQYSARDLAA